VVSVLSWPIARKKKAANKQSGKTLLASVFEYLADHHPSCLSVRIQFAFDQDNSSIGINAQQVHGVIA